jgi:hypothetical protein
MRWTPIPFLLIPSVPGRIWRTFLINCRLDEFRGGSTQEPTYSNASAPASTAPGATSQQIRCPRQGPDAQIILCFSLPAEACPVLHDEPRGFKVNSHAVAGITPRFWATRDSRKTSTLTCITRSTLIEGVFAPAPGDPTRSGGARVDTTALARRRACEFIEQVYVFISNPSANSYSCQKL